MKRLLKPRSFIWLLLPFSLLWVWKEIPLNQVVQQLLSLKAWQVLALVGFNFILTALFSLRWWIILAVLGYKIPYIRLSAYRLASFALSFLTPGPQFGGEPLQVFALAAREKVPNPAALASVMLDKTLELMVNFSFLAFSAVVVMVSGLLPGSTFAQAWLPIGILLGLPFGYLVLLILDKRPLTAIFMLLLRTGVMPSRTPSWIEMTRRAEDQSADFCRCRPAAFGLALGVSLAVWGLVMLEYWLSFYFLGLELSLPGLALTLMAARLALLLPVPGGLGTVEASQVLAIQFLGFNPAYAIGVMLLARLRDSILAALGFAITLRLTSQAAAEPLPHAAGEPFLINQEV